jgi:hypothetical protein
MQANSRQRHDIRFSLFWHRMHYPWTRLKAEFCNMLQHVHLNENTFTMNFSTNISTFRGSINKNYTKICLHIKAEAYAKLRVPYLYIRFHTTNRYPRHAVLVNES